MRTFSAALFRRNRPGRQRPIGLPRTLHLHLQPGLWEAFFAALGVPVVLSAPTSRATLERAELISETEHCLPVKLLDAHLEDLAGRIAELQAQQQRVLALLGSEGLPATPRLLTREAMVAIFRAAGLDDDGMDRLHAQFEQTDPAAHQRFLESLGLDAGHIARVRGQSR